MFPKNPAMQPPNNQETQPAAATVIKDPRGLGAALNDPRLKQQALVEINRSLLESYYTFKPGAPLKAYIQKKIAECKDHYTLAEVGFNRLPVHVINSNFYTGSLNRYQWFRIRILKDLHP